jgi:hypothetical protein
MMENMSPDIECLDSAKQFGLFPRFIKTRLHPVRCTVYLECQICNLNFVIIKISIKKRIQNIIILKLKVANTNRTTKDI